MTIGLQRQIRALGIAEMNAVTEVHGTYGTRFSEHRFTTVGPEDGDPADRFIYDCTYLQFSESETEGLALMPNVLVAPRLEAVQFMCEHVPDPMVSKLYEVSTIVGYAELPK